MLKFGCETPEDDELMTYILFAEAYGWSPKDIEDLSWDKVVKLRHLVMEVMKEKNEKLSMSNNDLRRLGL